MKKFKWNLVEYDVESLSIYNTIPTLRRCRKPEAGSRFDGSVLFVVRVVG